MNLELYKSNLPNLKIVNRYLKLSWADNQLSNFGPNERTLRERVAAHVGLDVDNVATLTNATLAIQGAIQTADDGSEEWLVPNFTFPATYLAAQASGKKYKIVDVHPTGRINFAESRAPRVEVWPFGAGPDINSFKPSRVSLIDAAASFDSLKNLGPSLPPNFGLVFSLHPTKTLVGAEGGVFISKNLDWVGKLSSWSTFGFDSDRTPHLAGTNAKMSEVAAAVALASLDEWQKTRLKWIETVVSVEKLLSDSGFNVFKYSEKSEFATNYVHVRVENAEESSRLLSSVGIPTRVWWTPASYVSSGILHESSEESFPESEKLYTQTLGMPVFIGIDLKLYQSKLEQLQK